MWVFFFAISILPIVLFSLLIECGYTVILLAIDWTVHGLYTMIAKPNFADKEKEMKIQLLIAYVGNF